MIEKRGISKAHMVIRGETIAEVHEKFEAAVQQMFGDATSVSFDLQLTKVMGWEYANPGGIAARYFPGFAQKVMRKDQGWKGSADVTAFYGVEQR